MHCAACGHENRPGRKFCGECGAALALSCRACGTANEPGEKFCGECGAALGSEAPARSPAASAGRAPEADVRKVVTIVFADLVGSTALHERLDPESVRRVMDRYYAALRAAVDAHGGTVVKLLGDGVMAAFGLKRVAEDDALRAVRAAAAMQDAFRALVLTTAALGAVGLRVAVNTGEVVVSGAQDDVLGDPVNVAARLQDQGRDGDVVVGEATRRLVATRVTLAPLGTVALKGRAEAVAVYRLESLAPPAGVAATPFVGREEELGRLEAVYGAAVGAPATRLAVLVGSPGLGKSRLIAEVARRHGDHATILTAHCDAAGGATFAPLAQALRRFLGLADGATGEAVRAAVAAVLHGDGDAGERVRIAGGVDALLGGSAMSPEETFFVVRRFLAGLAAAKPVVLVIDDLHWAEPLLFDLVEHLVQWGGGVPVFVLVGARPELRELRSSLVTVGGTVTDAVVLGGLDAGAAMRLAAGVIGAADLPAAVAAKVLATSEGNPLFVGELVRMLVQEGALTKDGERWTAGANLAAFEMPPTIHALLAARIERLGHDERRVLERAAVVGRHFSRSAVAALLGANGADLDAHLESLRRSELVERDTGWLLGEPALRFHHVLIRDAAYRRLLKGTRAELHERLAGWIEGQVGDAAEHDETIGWHLEQAHQLLRELGPLDAAGDALGERAARRLAAAGRRALARDDVALAAGLLGRAHARLAACRRDAMPCVDGARPASAEAPDRADLVLDWCEALLAAGDVGPAADAIVELDRVAGDASTPIAGAAEGSARLRAWHTCFAGQLTVLTAPEALHETADRVGAAARELAGLNDAAGEAKAHFVHAQALARLGKIGASEAALDQALAAARRAGDRRRANAVLAGAPLAALWGPSPVTRASGRCLDVVRVLRITQGAPAVEAVALSCQGVLEALRGRTEAARRMLSSSRTMVEELGISHRLYETEVFAGRIDLLEGDAPAAERALRAGYDGLRDLGLGIDAARAAALLGRALLAQGRAAEAEALSHESELLAGDDLQAAIAWRGVRAEALARRGDHAKAIAFAESAVAIAAATDALLDHADARLALAAALRAGGRQAEADAEERRALELWEAKGATVLADRARRSRPPAASPEAKPEDRAALARPMARRVRMNHASAFAARFEATFAAGDSDAVAALWADALEVVDHANGAVYDRDGHLASIRRLRRAREPSMRLEALATLGESLCLARRRIASSGTGGGRFDVGASEYEALVLFEVDERGSGRHVEIFSTQHLGYAIARLYQRYAEALAPGPERDRAGVAARAAAYMLTEADITDLALIYAATYEDIDHRTVGYGAVSGDALAKLDRSFHEVADDIRFRIDDVLALEPEGFVRKTTSSGVWREGGGAFERSVCTLSVFGPDGRVTNHETFDADREAEALARFDALTASAVSQPSEGRRGDSPRLLRANAATAAAARFDAAFAARDEAGLAALCADDLTVVDHPTGADYGRDGVLESHRRLLRMDGPTMRYEPLATLGECLALFRRRIRASGGRLDVGEYERNEIVVAETDAVGRFRHHETFAAERLRPAIVRLYERYAASLPEGPARVRPESVARTVALYDGPPDPDRIASGHSPSFVCVDHRIFGTWSAEGREAWRRHWREQAGLAAGFTPRDDDVLALDPGAYVLRTTFGGVGRASGATMENVVISVNVHDADGLIGRIELFEPDQKAEALARFERLTAEAAPQRLVRRPVRTNAASRTAAALAAAFARRDVGAVEALLADPLETIEHPTGTTYGRDGQLESSRWMMRLPDLVFRIEPLATLGESLCLARRFVAASGNTAGSRFEVGAYELESLVLTEVDATGRITVSEVFAPDHLGPAIGRLHTRYAESLPAGPERMRAEGIARNYEFWNGTPDPEGFRSVLAPTFVMVDHRSLGTWAAVGADEWIRHWRVQAELAEGFRRRDDDLLAFTPAVHVLRQTFVGTNRASDGPFENVVLAVCVFDADGRVVRAESYEPDEEALALARFDELVAGEQPAPTPRRRVRANAATPSIARFQSALAARDRDAIGDVFAESLQFVHHPTGATYGRRETLGKWRSIMKAEHVSFRGEALGTLGESMVLERHALAIDGLREGHLTEFGRIEFDEAVVIEVDDAGRWAHVELFEGEHLGDAIARLYARHAEQLSEGPARSRATMTARVVATMLTRSTAHRLEDVSAPDFQAVDHRTVGMGAATGSGFWQRWREATDELTQGPSLAARDRRAASQRDGEQTYRVEDVLALSADGLLRRTLEMGTDRASGGAFENSVWILSAFGPDGRQSRIELFDVGREAEALARYDALVGRTDRAGAVEPTFANAATRALDRFAHVTATRDWGGLANLCAADLRFDDRRPLFAMQLSKEGFLAQHRVLFDVPNARWVMRPIATRGERLTLSQILLQGDVADGGGALEIDHRGVIEVDDDGRMSAIVLFEPADLDAAYAELDERFEEGEGAAHGRVATAGAYARAYTNRDWAAVAAMVTPTFAEVDHRSVALLGTRLGPEAWAETERALVELRPDSVVRFDHVRATARGAISHITFSGARDGGAYEIAYLSVTELGDGGKLERNDLYEPEQIDEALARFAELQAPALPAERFANAASTLVAPVMAAIVAHDWQRFAGLYADDFRMSDRRRVAQLELDRDQFIAFTREGADGRTVRATSELLATRGERLALTRPVYEFSDADVGPSEVALLVLTEVDGRGRGVAQVRWDVEDLVAARSELERRWHVVEQVEHPRVAAFHVGFTKALAARDWDALATVLSPTLVAHDHRLVGWDVRHGPEAYVDVVRAMVDLAPDAEGRLDHARTCARGFLGEVVWVGTRDGGAFESPFVWVVELDDTGRAARFDFYDPHRLDAARARFAEIDRNAPHAALGESSASPGGTPDALAAIAAPNLATTWWDRWMAAQAAGVDTGGWEAMRELVAPGFVFDDRQRRALVRGDIELFIASARERAAMGARPEGTLVGTAGERIAIEKMLWSGGPSDGRFEIEYLAVIEVDATGRIVALTLYDLDDARAAQRDAWARWAAIEPHVAPWVEAAGTLVDAFDAHDRERLVVPFAADVVVEDHRRTGFGRIEGASAYADAVAVLWELAAEHHLDHGRFWPVVERHGFVATHDRFGTLADGGVFESRGLSLCVVVGDRITRVELFELEDLDRARARLAELRPDPLRIPPNAATRTWDRWCDAVVAGSLDVVATLYHPSYRFDDRRALIRLTTDRAGVMANDRLLMEDGWRPARTLLATAGDRFALQRILWTVGEAGGHSEVEILQLSEVDGEGRFVSGVTFDPGDRAAASAELFERYAASGADGTAPAALDAIRAWNAHDPERFRALLPADFYLHDHRRTGVGRLTGRDAYVDSLTALWELSRDIRLETLYSIAVTPHGRLWVCRWFGSNAEGGEFDAIYVCVGFHDDARGCLEIFELEDLELARARFMELRDAVS